jgi:hypothetical protein
MHFNIYDVFYSQYSHQRVSTAIAAIVKVMLLIQEHRDTNVINYVAVTP